jgi:hypothetical protein
MRLVARLAQKMRDGRRGFVVGDIVVAEFDDATSSGAFEPV